MFFNGPIDSGSGQEARVTVPPIITWDVPVKASIHSGEAGILDVTTEKNFRVTLNQKSQGDPCLNSSPTI